MKRYLLIIAAGTLSLGLVYLMTMTGDGRGTLPSQASRAQDDDDDQADPPPTSLPHDQAVAPLISRYCLNCHDREMASGGIVLEDLRAEPSATELLLYQKAALAMRSGSMPPSGKARPAPDEQRAFNAWLNAAYYRANCSADMAASGRNPIRRLNRAEYNNTIHDLTGLDIHPADDFPADDVGYGFDNIADVLSIPPLLTERYLDAAEMVVEGVFASSTARQRLMEAPSQDLLRFGLRGLPPIRDQTNKRLYTGPPPVDPIQQELERAANILRQFADRAYRRPITYDELNRLLKFVENSQREGEGIEPGLRLALQAILASPHFLFLPPADVSTVRIDHDFALASRLSYFLWSSMPDDELYQLAAAGKLREPRALAAQARRMLQDPRSRALVDNFAAQWLQLRNLKELSPDPSLFPNFDEALRSAMRTETELFCLNIIREDRSIVEFVDADFTFVNERLARHYGLAGVVGDEFRRVSLANTTRGGLLSQASILAVTSNPTRTSPVKRGRWIMENLLALPIPSPPPGSDDLKTQKSQGGTLRQQLERHRTDAKCASCHERMDPLGFGLENFDALGAWRDRDGDQLIDSSGTLAGQSFNGPAELRAHLRSRPDEFARCLSEKLLIYALGRALGPPDECAVDRVVRRLEKKGDHFSNLIVGIVLSEPFRQRSRTSENR